MSMAYSIIQSCLWQGKLKDPSVPLSDSFRYEISIWAQIMMGTEFGLVEEQLGSENIIIFNKTDALIDIVNR